MALLIKNLPASAGDIRLMDSIPESGKSPREENGNRLQCSCLENSMDRGAWKVLVHGVAKVGQDLVTKPVTQEQIKKNIDLGSTT